MFSRVQTVFRSSAEPKCSHVLTHNATQQTIPLCLSQRDFEHSSRAVAHSAQGSRPTNEDRYLIWQGRHPIAGALSIFAVFDGHNGIISVNLCRTHFVTDILSHSGWAIHPPPVYVILNDVVAHLESLCLVETRHRHSSDGTTLCAVLIYNQKVYTVNVGDSRVLFVWTDNLHAQEDREEDHTPVSISNSKSSPDLSTEHQPSSLHLNSVNCERLTSDHRVANPTERQRLIDAGAPIRRCRLMGITKSLQLSRALGDRDFKDLDLIKHGNAPGLIPTPDVSVQTAIKNVRSNTGSHDGMALLLVATDGLSDIDFFTDQDIAQLAVMKLQDGSKPIDVCKAIVDEGLRHRDQDNSTLIIVQLLDVDGRSDNNDDLPPSHKDVPQVGAGVVCDYWNASQIQGEWKKRLSSQLNSVMSNGKRLLRVQCTETTCQI